MRILIGTIYSPFLTQIWALRHLLFLGVIQETQANQDATSHLDLLGRTAVFPAKLLVIAHRLTLAGVVRVRVRARKRVIPEVWRCLYVGGKHCQNRLLPLFAQLTLMFPKNGVNDLCQTRITRLVDAIRTDVKGPTIG